MIDVEHLCKDYGAFRALDDVSFAVDRGEVVGFLGPNGAGKTTAMRILTGYMPPSDGQARVAGYDVFEDSLQVRKRIGYLPESVPLYTEMSVWAYLSFVGSLRRVPDREKAIWRAMEACHIEDRADTLIDKLSKGLRQRVGLGQRGLAHVGAHLQAPSTSVACVFMPSPWPETSARRAPSTWRSPASPRSCRTASITCSMPPP